MGVTITHFMRRPYPGMFSIERLHEDIRTALPSDCNVTPWRCRNYSKGLWPRLLDILAARKQQRDVNHVTGDVHYLTYLLDPRRTVLTVHDMVTFHRLCGPSRWLFWLFWYWLPIQRSRFVVAISHSTKDQLLAHVRCNPDKIRVIHNNVSDEFQKTIAHQFDTTNPRILIVGTKTNKNVPRIVEAVSGLNCRLSIVGSMSQEILSALDYYRVAFENHVGISRHDLVKLYSDCDMLVFASTYEGFGLPIVEANAIGRPVITSSTSSMPEVAADAACLVDPTDVASIRGGIKRVIVDSAYRKQLVEAGFINVQRFRLGRVTEQYARLYREIAGELGGVDP